MSTEDDGKVKEFWKLLNSKHIANIAQDICQKKKHYLKKCHLN